MSLTRTMAKFPLGRLLITPGASSSLTQNDVLTALSRHLDGDWGDVCDEDRDSNDEALQHSDRLLSVYHAEDRTKFWIITEWDRSVTTILLPSEY